jgi:hypothetical protein
MGTSQENSERRSKESIMHMEEKQMNDYADKQINLAELYDSGEADKAKELQNAKEIKARKKKLRTQAGPCILRYDSKFKTYWDLGVIILAIWNCLSIPVAVAYPDLKWMNESTEIQIIENCIDIIFLIDIIINFRTTFISPVSGLEIVDERKIAMNYIKGRLTVDVLATIPFEKILPLILGEGISQRQLQLLGLLKMVRMLRLGRIVTFMKMQQSAKLAFRIGSLIGALLLLIHWVGCIWYLLVQEKDTWLPVYDLNN